MDKFLEVQTPQKLNSEEKENLHRSITSNEIDSVIKNLHTKTSDGPNDFMGEFCQEIIAIILKFFQKSEEK
jgi:hypothetical protein